MIALSRPAGGTRGFEAPELSTPGSVCTPASDIFALGVTVRELKEAGVTVAQFKAAGYQAYELKGVGFKYGDMYSGGYSTDIPGDTIG